MSDEYNFYNLEAPFKSYLLSGNRVISPISINNYLSDLRHFFGWLVLTIKNNDIPVIFDKNDYQQIFSQFLNEQVMQNYADYLKANNIPIRTINRRLSTLRRFCSFCISQGWIKINPAKQISNLQHHKPKIKPHQEIQPHEDFEALESPIISPSTPSVKKGWLNGILGKLPFIGKRHPERSEGSDYNRILRSTQNDNGLGPQHYVGLALVLVLVAALGAGVYNQFFSKLPGTSAFPSQLTKPSQRYVSFQGRVTDSLGNPITTSTSFQFKLYNVKTAGSSIYATGTCSLTPDQDGILNVLVGGSGLTTDQNICGTGIPENIFSDFPNVYLGITIGADSEATPRQQIANVGYAVNAETLQGFPPGTGKSTIPYLNADGDVLIATSGASIKSLYESASFTVASSNNLVLQSAGPAGGAGDIILQATGSGTLRFRTAGASDTYTRLYVGNDGKIGANTASPDRRLEIIDSASPQLRLSAVDSTNFADLQNASTSNLILAGSSLASTSGTDYGVQLTPTINQTSGTAGYSALRVNVTETAVGSGTKNLLDLQVGGTSKFSVSNTGAITQTGTGQVTFTGDVDATNGLDVTTADLTVGGTNFTVALGTGNITTAGDLAVNGGDITTTATTFNLVNATATTLNIGGAATTLNVGPTGASGSIALSGGSADTGCTLDGITGNFTCSGNITGGSTGTVGYWTRSGTTLSPATSGDAVTTSGNISTSGTGTITSAGTLTASNGLTLTTGALSLTSTSGSAALTLSSSTTAFNVNSGVFDIDTTNSRVGIGNTAPTVALDVTGAGAFSSNLAVNGGSLTTTASTGNLLNTTATTLNIGGAATTISLGASTGTTTVNNATLAATGVLDVNGTGTSDIAGALNLSGSGTQLTATNDLLVNSTGGDIATDDRVTIGTTTAGVGQLNVSGAQTGKALAIFDETGDQNVFTASASGTTVFQLARTGNITTSGDAAINGGDITSTGALTLTPGAGTNLNVTLSTTGDFAVNTNQLYVDTSAGNVGIGTTNPANFKLEVVGNVGPTTGSLYDLGSSARRWSTVYGDTGNFTNISGTVTGGSTTSSDWLINSDNTTADTEDATLTFERGTPATNPQFRWNSTTKQITTNTPSFVISPDNSIALSGTAAFIVDQIQNQDVLTASASGVPIFTVAQAAGADANGFTLTSAAAAGTPTLAATGTDANIALSIDAKGTGALNLNNTATGDVLLAGGSGTTGCTVTNSTGALACSGAITTTATSGNQGWWNRTGTTLSPVTAGDAVTTSGAISTSGTGTITSAGTLTASNGLTLTTGALSLTGTSGSIALTGFGATSITSTTATGNIFSLTDTSLTTGTLEALSATYAPTAGGTQNAVNWAFTNSPSTSANTLRGLNLSFTDAGTLANTVIGLNVDVTTANANDTTYAAIFQGGNVGIGTTNPNSLLTVGATMTNVLTPNLSVNSTGNKPIFVGETGGNTGVMIGYGGSDIQGRSGTSFTNNTDLILNQYGGNVGVGDSGPDAKLEVLSTTEQLRLTNVDDTTDARFTVSATGDLTVDMLGSGTTDQFVLGDGDTINIGSGTASDVAYNKIGDAADAPEEAAIAADNDLYIGGDLEVDGTIYGTISATDLTCTDCLDFTDFEDTLDLDANLTLNQAAFTWTQNFTGTTTTGLTYNANSLTGGSGVSLASTQGTTTGLFTGDLANLSFSKTYNGGAGSETGNILDVSRSITRDISVAGDLALSGALATISDTAATTGAGTGTLTHSADVLRIAQNYTSNSGAALNVTTAGTGLALRVNDDGTFTDSTAFVVDASGNVGIGTTGPGVALDVVGTIRASNALYSGTLTSGSVLFADAGGLVWQDNANFYWDNTSKRLGIGDTTPDALLDLDSAATTTNVSGLLATALTTGNALDLSNTSTTATSSDLVQGDHTATYTTAQTVSGNLLDLSRALTINAAATTLTVSGALASLSDNCTVTLGTCTSTADVLQIAQNYASNSGAALNVTTAGTGLALRVNDDGTFTDTTPFVVDASGNVGIGTTGPRVKLEVNGDIMPTASDGTQGYMFRNSANTANLYFARQISNAMYIGQSSGWTDIRFQPGGGDAMTLLASGNVGIGTTNPANFKLEVVGNVGPTTGSLYDLGSSASRWSTVYGDTGNFTSISGTVTGGSTTSSDWLINSDNTTADTEDATLTFERGTPATNSQFRWNSTTKQITTNTPSFVISGDSGIAYSGTAALIVNQIQNQDVLTASASGTPVFTVTRPAGATANGFTLASAAAASGVSFAASGTDTNIALSIDAKGAGALNLNNTGTGDVSLAGGSGSTGCTVTNSTGALACSGAITTTATSGNQGWWNRTGTTLSPVNAGDAITTSGTGTITSAGTLTASNGLTLTTGALSLTGTSGSIALTGFGTTSITSTTATGNIFSLTDTSLTTGTLESLSATYAPTAGGTQNAVNWVFTNSPSTSANTLRGLNLSFTDAGILANTVTGLNVDVTTANANDTTYAAIFQGGNVGIGTTGPVTKLDVFTSTAGDTAIRGLNSATTGVNYGVNGRSDGSGATYNTGVYAYATGATNNYGLRIAAPAAGANNYAIYADGGAQSYFAGNVGIGTSTIGTNNRLIVNPYSTVDNLATAQINTNVATNKGLVVQGYTSQTANLQEWQNSNGAIIGSIGPSEGTLALKSSTGNTSLTLSANTGNVYLNPVGSYLQIANGAYGANIVSGASSYLGIGSAPVTGTKTNIVIGNTGDLGLVIKGSSGQTADLLQLQDSTPTTLTSFDESGNLRIGSSAPDTGKLNVTGAYTGKALAIFDETGDQSPLTASASGVPIFTVAQAAGADANGFTFTSSAASGTPTIAATGTDTNIALSIDAKGTGALNLNNTATGDILLAGGSGSTGCTVTNSTGALACAGNITGGATGTVGYWTRTGTTLSPATAGDAITTSGNISTSSTGTITSSGLLTASNGLTLTTGALSLTGTSGSIALTGFGTTAITSTTATGNIFSLTDTSLTTGTLESLSATYAPTAGGTQNAVNWVFTNSPSTSANTLRGLNLSFTDAGILANTVTGLNVDVTTANAADTTYAAVFQGGNVGIGTTGPTALLDVNGNTKIRGDLYFPSPASDTYARIYRNSDSLYLRSGDVYVGLLGQSGAMDLASYSGKINLLTAISNSNAYISFSPNNTERMRMSNTGGLSIGNSYVGTDPGAGNMIISGNVGIGTTSPTSLLHVNGAVTGKALSIFNETGDQAPLVASASGVPIFTVAQAAGADANGFTLTSATTAGTPTFAATGTDTNIALSIDGKGTGALNLNNTATGDILLGGGSGSTGCTVTNSTGALACSGNITGGSTGTVGYWTRTGTSLAPSNSGDAITTSGNISTTGTGTGTFAGLLTASSGITSSNAVNITGGYGPTSGAATILKLGGGGTSPDSSSISWGDGTGWKLNFGPIVAGVFTPKITFVDSGAATFASPLTASNGLTLTTGALNLTSTSGSAALTLTSSTTAFNVNSGLFDIDTTNSRVGIGTAAPGATLDVAGSAYVRGPNALYVDNLFHYTGGTTPLLLGTSSEMAIRADTHNVGIGTTAPTSRLHVTGAVTGKALAIFNETGDQAPLTASASGVPIFTVAQAAGADANGFTFTSSAASGTPTIAATGTDTNIALSIDGKGTGALNLNNTATGDILLAGGSGSTGCTVTNSTGALACAGGVSGATLTDGTTTFSDTSWTSTSAIAWDLANSQISALNIESGLLNLDTTNSRVGIGTTTPGATLHVSGTTSIFGAGEGGTPTATTIRGAAASGTNVAGADLTFAASNGTGSGGSGNIIFSTAPADAGALTFDATSNGGTDNGDGTTTSFCWTHTTGSASNRILIVGESFRVSPNGLTVSSVTYGSGTCGSVTGQSLTNIGSADSGANSIRSELWRIVAPTTGTNTIQVTFSAAPTSGTGNSVGGAVTYSGVDQTTPLGTFASATGSSTAPSVNVTSATGEVVVDTVATRNITTDTTLTSGAGQTERWNRGQTFAGPININGGGSTEDGAATTTMSWTINSTSQDWAIAAVPIKPASGATTPNTLTERLRITNTGNVGIGTTGPDSPLDVLSTGGTQLRLTYTDGSVYTTLNTDSSGNLTIDGTGTKSIIADDLQVTGNDILDSGAATRITLGATTTLTNTTTTLSGTTTLTASSLATLTTAATLGMSSTTTLNLGSNATINGGTAANDDLTLQGTTNATRTTSYVLLQPNGGNVGIGTSAPEDTLDVRIASTPASVNTNRVYSMSASGNVYDAATNVGNSIATLDSTNVVVAYAGATNTVDAKIGVVNETVGTIAWGTSANVITATSVGSHYNFGVAALNSTHFVVCWATGTSNVGQCKVGSVSGTTITLGSAVAFNASAATYASVTALDSTHFAVSFLVSSTGRTRVGVTDGATTISSYGTEATFNSGNTAYISSSTLSSSSFIVSYQDTGNSSYGTSVAATVSGSTITFGGETVFNTATTATIAVTDMTSTSFINIYGDGGESSSGFNTYWLRVGTVSGTTITFGGAEYPTGRQSNTMQASISNLNSTDFLALPGISYVVVGSVSGYVVTLTGSVDPPSPFFDNTNSRTSMAVISGSSAVVAGTDQLADGNSYVVSIDPSNSGSTLPYSSGSGNHNAGAANAGNSVAKLDSNHIVVAYTNTTSTVDVKIGTAGQVNSNNISVLFGTSAQVINATGAGAHYNFGVAALDSTHFVVCWATGTSNVGQCKVGSVAGNVITLGSASAFNASAATYASVTALDSTHFAVSYYDPTSGGRTRVGLTDGATTISSYGTEATFNAAQTSYISSSTLSSTSFVVSYQDTGNSSYGTAVAATVSGTTITFGSETVFNAATTTYTGTAALSSTSFAIAYRDDGNSNAETAILASVSVTTITFGVEYDINTNGRSVNNNYVTVTALNSSRLAFVAEDGVGGKTRIGSVSGLSMVLSSGINLTSGSATPYFSMAGFSDSLYVISYTNSSGNGASTFYDFGGYTNSDNIVTNQALSVNPTTGITTLHGFSTSGVALNINTQVDLAISALSSPNTSCGELNNGDFGFDYTENGGSSTKMFWKFDGYCSYWTSTGGFDVAEHMPLSEAAEAGDILAADPQNRESAIRSSQPYQQSLIGIVSTKPYLISNREDVRSSLVAPLTLTGRVPVKVTSENVGINIGDPVTSSSTKGMGMKATESGPIVGKALEKFDPENIPPSQYITCPDGTKEGVVCAKILVLVNVSWYDPLFTLNSTGEMQFARNELATDETNKWNLTDSLGNLITRVAAFSKVTSAYIKAGLIRAEELIAKNITSTEKIISPVIETTDLSAKVVTTADLIATGEAQINQISTNVIKPQKEDITVDLSQPINASESGALAKIIIKGLDGKTVSTIDASGNATFSGTLAAEKVQTNEASVSGKLFAKEIESSTISNIKDSQNQILNQVENDKSVVSEHSSAITELRDRLQLAAADSGQARMTSQELSSSVNDIQALLADIRSQPLSDPQYYQDVSNNSVVSSITVSGDATFFNARVANTFTAGTIKFENNEIIAQTSELKISALSSVNILDGAVVIARDGTMTTSGKIIAKGGIEVQNSDLRFKNQEGIETASIDSSGSAQFKSLSLDKYLDATSSAIIATPEENFNKNGLFASAIETEKQTAGIGLIPTNVTEIIIYNETVKKDSLIYLTPTTQTLTQLTVTQKNICTPASPSNCKPYFKVTSSQPIHPEVGFNWLIIN